MLVTAIQLNLTMIKVENGEAGTKHNKTLSNGYSDDPYVCVHCMVEYETEHHCKRHPI